MEFLKNTASQAYNYVSSSTVSVTGRVLENVGSVLNTNLQNQGRSLRYSTMSNAQKATFDPKRFLTETNAQKGQPGYDQLKQHRQTAADHVTDKQWLFENHTKKFLTRYPLREMTEDAQDASGSVGDLHLQMTHVSGQAKRDSMLDGMGRDFIATPGTTQTIRSYGMPGETLDTHPIPSTNLPMSQVQNTMKQREIHSVDFQKQGKGIDIADAIKQKKLITTTELSGCSIVRDKNTIYHLRPDNDKGTGEEQQDFLSQQSHTEVLFGPRNYRGGDTDEGRGVVLFKPKIKDGKEVLRVYTQSHQANGAKPKVTSQSLTPRDSFEPTLQDFKQTLDSPFKDTGMTLDKRKGKSTLTIPNVFEPQMPDFTSMSSQHDHLQLPTYEQEPKTVKIFDIRRQSSGKIT